MCETQSESSNSSFAVQSSAKVLRVNQKIILFFLEKTYDKNENKIITRACARVFGWAEFFLLFEER